MIDIHNHMLYGVDDGPREISESLKMLHEAKGQNVDTIILTPHYRHGMFKYNLYDIDENFENLSKEAFEIGIKLFLGCEYHVDGEIVEAISSGRCHSLGDGRFILAEYSHNSEYRTIYRSVQEILSNGYTPIIAHAERYPMLVKELDNVNQLRRMGCFIQSNADSILGIDGRFIKKICKKLLKNQLIDIVASDAHGVEERSIHLKECYRYIEKKYGTDYADKLFYKNPGIVVSSIEDR